MPHPKYPLGKKRSSADRQFTDREEFVGAFERIISDFPLEKQKILAYYGVGGIGKTRLLKELCQQLEEGRKEIAWAVLDFATKTHRDVEGGLSWLRRELARKYKVQFPSYEMARLQFLQKSRPNTPLQREELPWLGEDVAETISILEDIPIVGLAPKAFRIVKNHTNGSRTGQRRGIGRSLATYRT